MANPQKENGHTDIANDLLEAVIGWDGPGRVKDFVLAVMRETYGWSKRSKPIPAWRLGALLRVSERRVRQLRDQALACNVVTYDEAGGYAVQKDFDAWVVPPTGRVMDGDTRRRLSAGPYSAGPAAEDAGPYPQDRLPANRPVRLHPAEDGTTAKAEDGPAPPLEPPLGCKAKSKNDVTPTVADAGASPAVPVDGASEQRPARTKPQGADDPAAALEALRAQFPEGTLTAVEDFVTLRRAHRAGGRITAGALVTLHRDLLRVATEPGMTPQAFAYGVAEAVHHDADNVNYAAAAARNYTPPAAVKPRRSDPPEETQQSGSWKDIMAQARAEGMF